MSNIDGNLRGAPVNLLRAESAGGEPARNEIIAGAPARTKSPWGVVGRIALGIVTLGFSEIGIALFRAFSRSPEPPTGRAAATLQLTVQDAVPARAEAPTTAAVRPRRVARPDEPSAAETRRAMEFVEKAGIETPEQAVTHSERKLAFARAITTKDLVIMNERALSVLPRALIEDPRFLDASIPIEDRMAMYEEHLDRFVEAEISNYSKRARTDETEVEFAEETARFAATTRDTKTMYREEAREMMEGHPDGAVLGKVAAAARDNDILYGAVITMARGGGPRRARGGRSRASGRSDRARLCRRTLEAKRSRSHGEDLHAPSLSALPAPFLSHAAHLDPMESGPCHDLERTRSRTSVPDRNF